MKKPHKSNKNESVIGYRKPPVNSQFKPGRSGNPKGRPKGSLNISTALIRNLRERVIINENGRRKSVTKLEATLAQVINKAACGDLKAVTVLTNLVRSAEERAIVETAESKPPLSEVDDRVISGILKRFELANREKSEDETESDK